MPLVALGASVGAISVASEAWRTFLVEVFAVVCTVMLARKVFLIERDHEKVLRAGATGMRIPRGIPRSEHGPFVRPASPRPNPDEAAVPAR
jgi:hypothetical protein